MLLRLVIVELHLPSRLAMREQLSLHISIPPLLLYSHHVLVQTEREVGNDLRALVVASLGEHHGDAAFFDQSQHHSVESRPVESLELSAGHKAVRAPMPSLSSRYYKLSPFRCLLVYAVLLGGIHHGLDIFRLCLIEERPVAHDKATTLTDSIYEFLDVISHVLGCAQTQHGGGHVADEASILTQCSLGFHHI
jgi:hypothetical protein